ncbi:MAG: hypothetical protein QOJ71_3001 [Actinomycetota bacterium]|nr:hypothetical protein [Actinomycetota bacterium]
MLVSAAEHPADGELNDRIQRPESWFDLHVVADHAAATRVVQEGAFVSPDTVLPTGGGLTKAALVGQGDQLNVMTVDRDEAEQQLPKHRSTCPPRFSIEVGTMC